MVDDPVTGGGFVACGPKAYGKFILVNGGGEEKAEEVLNKYTYRRKYYRT